MFQPTYKPFGESAILVEWPQEISKEILNDIRLLVSKIEAKKLEEILELNFIYHSLLIRYQSNKTNFTDLKNKLQLLYEEKPAVIHHLEETTTIWEIPVCYDAEFGIDLSFLSAEKKLSIEEIISIHSNAIYTVYGIGFLPGFLYLGGLSEKLHHPRRDTPRMAVPKGAVAIGGNQTGIYPQISPGGWQIIGKTPISMFDIKKDNPCLVVPGDEIKFKSISKDEFEMMALDCEKGTYELKKAKGND
ncbi:MAG: 5-oxoprolinase subunit PxpB [Flavobacteriaceae bacterium]|nr:5-oxoprolinase subunit PxpB [Flavobacteriaceae bacterium]